MWPSVLPRGALIGFSLTNRWIRVEVFTFVIRAVALKSRLDDVAFGLTNR